MLKIFIASSNAHKIGEIGTILKENGIEVEILCPKDFDDNSEPVEDGKTFKENAYIKAKYYFDKYHYPTLADDSGISIDFYNGGPGIYSARFMPGLTSTERNARILEEMKGFENRKAKFTCNICYIDAEGKVNHFEAYLNGEIAKEMSGKQGFGYDPIFYVPELGKTTADLDDYGKNQISHRHNALLMWAKDQF